MAKFKKKTKVSQAIPTSALPDIIFILLFFFMVTTKVKPTESKVEITKAKESEIAKLDESKEIMEIRIGKPRDVAKFGSEPVIEVAGKFISVAELPNEVNKAIGKMPISKRSPTRLLVNLKVDKGTHMGVVIDVKQMLRNMNVLNIDYNADKGGLGE